jgi:hypothetical protein
MSFTSTLTQTVPQTVPRASQKLFRQGWLLGRLWDGFWDGSSQRRKPALPPLAERGAKEGARFPTPPSQQLREWGREAVPKFKKCGGWQEFGLKKYPARESQKESERGGSGGG